MEGDAQKDMVLTEARAMVVRDYLVENFGFDDSQLKTLALGKQAQSAQEGDWGSIQILIFPSGTQIPSDKSEPASGSSRMEVTKPIQIPDGISKEAASHQDEAQTQTKN